MKKFLDKELCIKTAQTTWFSSLEFFVTESPYTTLIRGVGISPEESMMDFLETLEEEYKHALKGDHHKYFA